MLFYVVTKHQPGNEVVLANSEESGLLKGFPGP